MDDFEQMLFDQLLTKLLVIAVGLYELGKAYEKHPIFAVLTAMLGDVSFNRDGLSVTTDSYELQAERTTIIDIQAREPNMPVFVTAKSGKPFSVVQTTTEVADIPDRLVPIDNLLRDAYWKAFRTI